MAYFYCDQGVAIDLPVSPSSNARKAVATVYGGLLAAIPSGIICLAFFPLPEDYDYRNHAGEAFTMVIIGMFICGGFIGLRSLNAEKWSDVMLSVIGSYVGVTITPLFIGLSSGEVLPIIGIATIGIFASAVGSLLVHKLFPPVMNKDNF